MRVSLILAISTNGTIGKDNDLPWHLPADLKRFKKLTVGHAIIMGRKTYESIGKPLPKRRNIVVTSKSERIVDPRVLCASSLDAALELANPTSANPEADPTDGTEVFIIGGARLFAEALPRADHLYLTRVEAILDGDVRFELPELDVEWQLMSRETHPSDQQHAYPFAFEIYRRALSSDPTDQRA